MRTCAKPQRGPSALALGAEESKTRSVRPKRYQGSQGNCEVCGKTKRGISKRFHRLPFHSVQQWSEQNPAIEQIVQTTEESHERAEAGLEQVQQAARHQAGCVMS